MKGFFVSFPKHDGVSMTIYYATDSVFQLSSINFLQTATALIISEREISVFNSNIKKIFRFVSEKIQTAFFFELYMKIYPALSSNFMGSE